MHELIVDAMTGSGAVVLVEGAAGIGKTSLLRRATAMAAEQGCAVAGARGSELERDFAFGLVRQLLEPLLAALEVGERVEVLSGAAGLAAPILETVDAAPASPRDEVTQAALHGLYWVTANLAERRPVALVVDDAHWGDAPSLRFLAYLANRIDGVPVALTVGARPAEPQAHEELLAQLLASPATSVLRPAPLTGAAVDELVRRALGPAADPSFSAACAEATKGNPLLLGELLATLAGESVAPVASQAGAVAAVAPPSVSRSVARRLRRLAPEAVELGRAAAVLGADPRRQDAAELAGLSPESAASAAKALAEAGILDPTTLEFVHPVVRAAVYAELPAPQRGDAHRQAARLLAKRGAPEDEVALHLLASEPSGDRWAVGVLRRAARRAHARGGPDVAATHLHRALAERPPASERVSLLVELGSAESAAADEAGLDHLGQALELEEDVRVRAAIALELAKALSTRIQLARAAEVLEGALAELGRTDRGLSRRLEAQRLSVRVADPTLHTREFKARLTTLYLVRGRLSDPVLLGTVAVATAMAIPPASAAAGLAERALAAGLTFEDEQTAFATAAGALMLAGGLERARTVWDEAVAGARRRGSLSALGMGSSMRAFVHLRLGALGAADADLREVQRNRDQIPPRGVPAVLAARSAVLLERGELNAAAAVLGELDLDAERIDAPTSTQFRAQMAEVLVLQGRVEEGIAHLRECGRLMKEWGVRNPALMPWRSSLALALRATGERDEALALVHEEVRLARAFALPRELGIALRAAGLVEGGADGLDLLREAVAELESSPARLERARALTDLGAAMRRRGRRALARDPLRRGLDLAHRCGAVALRDRAHRELVATGARPRRLVLSGLDALTASERRVAEMATEGLTNREIAQALFVTQKTVETHLGNTYRKLDIGSRSQLAGALEDQVAAGDDRTAA